MKSCESKHCFRNFDLVAPVWRGLSFQSGAVTPRQTVHERAPWTGYLGVQRTRGRVLHPNSVGIVSLPSASACVDPPTDPPVNHCTAEPLAAYCTAWPMVGRAEHPVNESNW